MKEVCVCEAMKSPVGTLSNGTVLRQQDGGTKSRQVPIWQKSNLTLEEAAAYYKANEPKGECVLVIEGKSRESILQEERAKWEEMTVQEHMDYYMNQGIDKKEAMKKVAKDRGVGKRDIYKELL